jgi:hypothetical protein
MSDFVNLRKRGVQLPAGCKDLIDVLQRGKGRAAAKFTFWPAVRPPALAKYLSRLLRPATGVSQLVIAWTAISCDYLHFKNEAGRLTIQSIIWDETNREAAVRGVFAAAGLPPILDAPAPGASFMRVLEHRLPNSASEIEKLTLDVLGRGFGLAADVCLQVGFWKG